MNDTFKSKDDQYKSQEDSTKSSENQWGSQADRYMIELAKTKTSVIFEFTSGEVTGIIGTVDPRFLRIISEDGTDTWWNRDFIENFRAEGLTY